MRKQIKIKKQKMPKEYNARGERIYKNAINRENTKKNKKNKIKQDEKSKSERGRSSHAGGNIKNRYFEYDAQKN